MKPYISANVGLMDRSGSGLNETSSSSVGFDVLSERTDDKLGQVVALLKYLASVISDNEKEVADVLRSANSGRSDLRDQLKEIGLNLDELELTKNEAS